MTRKTSPFHNRPVLGLFICGGLILFALALPVVLSRPSAEDSKTHTQSEEQIGILGPVDREWLAKVSRFVLISSGASLAGALYFGLRRSSSIGMGARLSISTRSRGLILIGGISLAIYALHFLLPFPLSEYYNFQRVSVGWLTKRDPVAAIGYSLSILALFSLYHLAYHLSRGQNARRLWSTLALGALSFSAVNFFVFPLHSTDLYDYTAHGRITGVHGANPYTNVPEEYPDDPQIQLAAWRKTPTAYGPLWEVISGIVGRTAGDSLWVNALAYKGLAIAGYLVSVIMVALILRKVSPTLALAGTFLFAWNPLVLLEGVANLHNDMLMIALLLCGIWALSHARGTTAAGKSVDIDRQFVFFGILGMTLVGISILVKFIPILFLPFLLVTLLAPVEGRARKFGMGIALILPLALICFYYFRIFWEWPQIMGAFIRRFEMFRMSLSSVTYEIARAFFRTSFADRLGTWPYLAAFAVGYGVALVRTGFALHPEQSRRINETLKARPKFVKWVGQSVLGSGLEDGRRPWEVLVGACFQVIALYLLFGNPWFWPWYLIWPIAFLALSGDEHLTVLLTVVACMAQLTHVLWNFPWYWMGTTWGNLYLVDIIAVALMLVPAMAVHYQLRRRSEPAVES